MNNKLENFLNNVNVDQSCNNVLKNYFKIDECNPFKIISPDTMTRKSFYHRVNTSPVKRKNEFEEENVDLGKTLNKIKERICEKNYSNDAMIIKCENSHKENDFLFINSSVENKRFTSNSNAKNRVRHLITEGEWPEKKPTLNCTESRNKILEFSKKKVIEPHSKTMPSNSKIQTKCTKNDENEYEDGNLEEQNQEDEENENDVEEEEVEDVRKVKRLTEYEISLRIPVNKKNDEKFKILKLRDIRRESLTLPINKSAKANDIEALPTHQKEFINEYNYSLCKKKKISHSAKRRYSSHIGLSDPKRLNYKYNFPVYRDNEVGINEYWQAPLIETKADEDIPTDDEQLIFADHYVNAELNEGFDIFTEKGAHSLRNKYFITLPNGQSLLDV